MKNEIITINKNAPIVYDIKKKVIGELKEKASQITIISNKEERKIADAIRKEAKSLRSKVEKRRKELKQDALEWGRKVDAEAKRLKTEIEKAELPLEEIIKNFDEQEKRREEERLAKIHKVFDSIKTFVPNAINKSSDEIGVLLEKFAKIKFSKESMQEFYDEANILYIATSNKLKEMLDDAKKREEELVRLEQERKEQEKERKRLAQEKAELEAKMAEFKAMQAKEEVVPEKIETQENEPVSNTCMQENETTTAADDLHHKIIDTAQSIKTLACCFEAYGKQNIAEKLKTLSVKISKLKSEV